MSQEPLLAGMLLDALAAPAGSHGHAILTVIDDDDERRSGTMAQLRALLTQRHPDVPAASLALDQIDTLEDFADSLAGGFGAWFERELGIDLALPRFDRVWDTLASRGIEPAAPEMDPVDQVRELGRLVDRGVAQPLRRFFAGDALAVEQARLDRLAPAELRRALLAALADDLAAELPLRGGRRWRAVAFLNGPEDAFEGQGVRRGPDGRRSRFDAFLYDTLSPALVSAGVLAVTLQRNSSVSRPAGLVTRSYTVSQGDPRTAIAVQQLRDELAALGPAPTRAQKAAAHRRLAAALLADPRSGRAHWLEALALLEAVLVDAEAALGRHDLASFHKNLGTAHAKLARAGDDSHWQAAERYYELALAAHAAEDPGGEAWRLDVGALADLALRATDAEQQRRLRRSMVLSETLAASPDRRFAPAGQWLVAGLLLELRDDHRRQNVDRAIDLLNRALVATDRSRHPGLWSSIQRRLGQAWLAQYGPQRPEFVERARRCYEAALAASPLAVSAERHCTALYGLSTAVWCLPLTDAEDHRAQALRLARQAAFVDVSRISPSLSALLKCGHGSGLLAANTLYLCERAATALQLAQEALDLAAREGLPTTGSRLAHRVCALALAEAPGPGRPARRAEAEAHVTAALALAEGAPDCAEEYLVRAALPHLLPSPDRFTDLRACLADCAKVRLGLDVPRDPSRAVRGLGWEALAWALLPSGNKAENVQRAIAAADNALSLAQRSGLELDAAEASLYLAVAWRERPAGDRESHLRRALEYCEQALAGLPAARLPIRHHEARMLAASILIKLSGADLSRAHEHLDAARAAFDRAGMRREAAQALILSGEAHTLAGAPREAVTSCEAALAVVTQEDEPIEWGRAQHVLGDACTDLGEFDRALACYEAALTIRTPEWTPHDWAATQASLGVCRALQPDGREVSLHWAVDCFEAALTVFTMEDMPHAHGATQDNLARAWSALGDTDRAAECRAAAVAGFEAAGAADGLRLLRQDADDREAPVTRDELGSWFRRNL